MTISSQATPITSMARTKKPSRYLTPLQLAELKKGPRANILIGPEGDFYIGLEGVAVNLLAYYSSSAKEALVDEGGSAICIPDGSNKPLRWIYKYMQAGEKDPEGEWTFEQLSVDCLITLYSHSAPLHYESLMNRVVGRLRAKYHEALPTVQEIKDFRDFVPPLYEHSVNILAHELLNPWTCDYSAYTEFATADKDFGDKLEKTVQKLLKHRVKAGKKYYEGAKNRHLLSSQQYYANLGNAQTKTGPHDIQKPTVKLPATNAKAKEGETLPAAPKKKGRRGGGKFKNAAPASDDASKLEDLLPDKGKDAQKKQRKVTTVRCWNCNGRGHRSRDCTIGADTEVGADAKTSEKSKPKSEKPKPTAHSGTDGLAERSTKRPARTQRGKRDRYVHPIEVTGNGEGLRTCDREVRSGELTRTGLVI